MSYSSPQPPYATSHDLAPSARLPRPRLSLRAVAGFSIFYLVGYLFCQRFVWQPRDQGITEAQKAALASAPDSQRWLWNCGENTQVVGIQASAPAKGQAPPFNLGWGPSVILSVEDREGMRALLRSLAGTGPFVPLTNAQKNLPDPPGSVSIFVSGETLCLAKGQYGSSLTWHEAGKTATITPHGTARFVRAVRWATARVRRHEGNAFLLDMSMR